MKEKFQVTYGNTKYNVLRKGVGKYEVFFPTRYDEDGNKYFEYMYRDSENKMWIMMSKSANLPDYFYCIAYLDNGEVGWTKDKGKKAEWIEGTFNPYSTPENDVQENAQKMHGIFTEIYSYEKLAVPTDDINNIREQNLNVILKFLGYMSPDDVKYGDAKFEPIFGIKDTGDALKKYISLSRYTYRTSIKDSMFEGSKITNKEMRDEAVNRKLVADQNVQESLDVMNRLIDDLVSRRGFDSSYGTNMKRKLPEREWNIYFNMANSISRLVMGLNYDLLEDVDKNGIEDLTKLTDEEIEKRVSELLNSKDYKEACNIENWFVKRACISLIDGVNEAQKEDRLGSVGTGLEKLKQGAEAEKEKREALIEAYRAERYDAVK